MSREFTVGELKALPLQEADLPALSRLCLRCSAFFELIEGAPASEMTAAEILRPLADEYARGTKHVFGIHADGEVIAVAELLQGHPTATDWYIGLLLVDPTHRRIGIGRRFASAILNWIVDNGGAAVRLVVQQQNSAAATFWMRQGFEVENEIFTRTGHRKSLSWVFVRSSPAA
jgi:ribosomal protein S18 acetylase RimI-like enzyme